MICLNWDQKLYTTRQFLTPMFRVDLQNEHVTDPVIHPNWPLVIFFSKKAKNLKSTVYSDLFKIV